MKHRIIPALFAASAALALAGCVTDGYGYGGVDVGYGGGYGYSGSPYYGWYDDYYYPGTGYYVYDRGGARHRWSDGHRAYWEGRRGNNRPRDNWSGFRRDGDANGDRRQPAWRGQGDAGRQPWRDGRAQQQGQPGQQMAQPRSDAERQSRREAWQAQRQQQGATAQPGQPEAPRAERPEQRQRQGATPGWRGRGNRDAQ
jgi:hypothetical protein